MATSSTSPQRSSPSSPKKNRNSSGPEPSDDGVAIETRTAQAQRQIDRALDLVEQAQRLLGEAQQALCRVQGMIPEWTMLGRVHDRVTRAWFGVAAKARRLR